MTKHLTLIAFIIASLQVLAIDTKVPELHWTLPTTLEGIRQERANLKIEEEPMPVSIMCQGRGVKEVKGVKVVKGDKEVQVDVDKSERYWTVKRDMTLASAPYIALGIALHAVKRDVRKVNNDINDGFNNKVDDYLQYAPLALTYGLKATGYQGRSQWGRLLVSNAFSAAIMAALVNGIKYSTKVERPDGSTSNSFPSGHTATAFMAATILHKEYGLTRSLWYSVGGYAVATGIGAFRVMNNRHWVSDVMMGAGIGILSTELGYALSDLIFKDKYTLRKELEDLNDVSEHPSFFSLQAGVGIMPGRKDLPSEIVMEGGPIRIKHGISSVIATEAAYFINPHLGFGLRARINSTAVTPEYETSESSSDQLSSFDVMGGVYGGLPLNKRMSLGTKLLFGRRHLGDIEDKENDVTIEGGNSFIFGTGFYFSYALKHNIVWRAELDYDFTRTSQTWQNRSFRLPLHQLTPNFGICFSF